MLPAEIQDQISAYLQRFWTVDGFLADIKDDTPNPIATYFGFAIRKRMGLLQPADLAWFFHFFIGALEHANKTIDYAIPETIANVLHCKKFFNAFEMEPDFQPFGFPLDGDCLFMQPYVKQLLECPNPVGGDIIRFSEPDKVQQDFQVGRQVVAQEVAQLLREPKLIFKKPVLLPKPPVEVNPFAFLNPVEEAKREGKISQNGNMEDILEEMGTSVGNLGNVLSAVKAPGRDINSQKTAEPVTNGNPQPSQKTLENKNQGSPERQGKTDARGKPTNMALLEEQLALDARREKLKEWIIRAMPTATKFQVEADVEEILKLEKTHQLDVYLDYLRREKRVDTKDFPAT